MYGKVHERWLKTHKSWAAFVHPGVWEKSYPQKSDTYANLMCKLMTGSFWTNRRAQQWDEKADNTCEECTNIMGEPVKESHQHVLGECLRVIPQLDELWTELKGLFAELKVQSSAINPWFHCSEHYDGLYQLPAYLGDKGLLPKELPHYIRRENKGIDNEKVNKVMRGILYLVKNRVRAIYLSQFC